ITPDPKTQARSSLARMPMVAGRVGAAVANASAKIGLLNRSIRRYAIALVMRPASATVAPIWAVRAQGAPRTRAISAAKSTAAPTQRPHIEPASTAGGRRAGPPPPPGGGPGSADQPPHASGA